ncbi:conserved hypothetical protein [Vibrio nigripulchritudo MADA3029]|uniref:DUF3634 domain-containing protein n=1 Tax=Vibrio nigripulchritudo TaxID=28173 RepID=U4KFJ1_9VIBR|nr:MULTISPECIES: DUF3634 family protein [Vibrio]UAB68851.1 DUF3634 family protein [Vibrio sp. SCSIO 43132]CCN34048.1 conserved hypothetical protein [Vibrio nigripulchritudo AM115]CCN40536.1 conserved hypothetical protein [Vibrio nigripulchritudo FTn2]CCN46738.1 conserved hypothetical protein [Vibrio nigripulchritudo MADA3020]CCN51981.1 conserved hypothetical protein [Vibrio nigripulchritudo MADA3021]
MLWLLLVAAVVIFWLVGVDRPKLKMEFKDGELSSHKGHLPAGFKHNCLEIAHKNPFSGVIKVYTTRNGARLTFTKSIPNKIQQRIRNVFPHQGFKNDSSKKSA